MPYNPPKPPVDIIGADEIDGTRVYDPQGGTFYELNVSGNEWEVLFWPLNNTSIDDFVIEVDPTTDPWPTNFTPPGGIWDIENGPDWPTGVGPVVIDDIKQPPAAGGQEPIPIIRGHLIFPPGFWD